MCYHGAFVTGKSLHEEHWIDLGGGALKKQGFCLAQRDVTLPSNAKADAALTEYTVVLGLVLSMESTGLQVIRTKSPISLTKITSQYSWQCQKGTPSFQFLPEALVR